jgi:DNA-directed RNA polymerase specialized sigma24 family protein
VVEAFEGWYLRLHPRVVGVVFVACGDEDVAADATDEAFARALTDWKRVAAMTAPDAWVCRVAVNVMKRRLRRRYLERRLLGRPGSVGVGEPDVHPELWRAVRALPERQRLAILLRYVADLQEADIAMVMGVTRGTVSASLAAARSRLGTALGRLSPSDTNDVEAPHG